MFNVGLIPLSLSCSLDFDIRGMITRNNNNNNKMMPVFCHQEEEEEEEKIFFFLFTDNNCNNNDEDENRITYIYIAKTILHCVHIHIFFTPLCCSSSRIAAVFGLIGKKKQRQRRRWCVSQQPLKNSCDYSLMGTKRKKNQLVDRMCVCVCVCAFYYHQSISMCVCFRVFLCVFLIESFDQSVFAFFCL